MYKRNSVVVLLIVAILVGVTIFLSPVNRIPLELKSENSGISDWEYIPGEGGLEGDWTSIGELQESTAVMTDIFWLRGKLPEEASIYSPALCLEFDFPVEVFVEGRKIYSYGTMKDVDRVLSFQHVIPIKDEYKGKLIYFKYPTRARLTVRELRYLTSWDLVSESEKTRLLEERQIIPLFLCAMGVFVGLCLVAIAAFQRSNKGAEANLLAYAGGFVFLTSINIINSLYAVSSALNKPVLTFYLDYLSYYLIPFAAGSFMVALLKTAPKTQMKIINSVFPLFLASVLLLSGIQGFDISKSDIVFNTAFLSYTVFMVYLLFRELMNGNKELKILITGLIFIGLTGVVDILSLLNVTENSRGVTHIGIFALSLSMVAFFALRYERLFDDVRTANTQLVRSKEIIEHINKDLDRKVVEKTSAIRSLFDSAEQGFLSFKGDLKVESEYSFKCREIFCCDISGQSLPELISDGDCEQEEYIYTLLKSIFDPKDVARREVYLSLLPGELTISDKLVSLDYKMIDKHTEGSELTCMVILTDITEKKLLEMRLKQEQSILKMCVAIVANHTDFVNAVTDYRDFCGDRVAEILNSDTETESKYAELFRMVHTFKGTFAYFEMRNIANKLHDLETKLYSFSKADLGLEGLEVLFSESKPGEWLKEDFDILREVLGERYLKLDKLVVAEESKLKEIENRILGTFAGNEGLKLIGDIRKLRYRSLKDMLGHYPGYCIRLSERQEKQIKEFEIQGSDIEVNPDIYSELSKSMVHIFRNLIDHGIEPAEERVHKLKSEQGNIMCSIEVKGDNIEITAADDGAGIDTEEIRKLAVDKGFIAPEEAAAASEAEILNMLFADGFSTTSQVTELSGRGLGLSAVKAEVVKLKGSIEVRTKKGIGTSFHISVPVDAKQ